MDKTTMQATARQWIAGFDRGAHRAIAGYRSGAGRLGSVARARWDRAFAESSPKLSAETRRNASHFRDVVAGYYGKGVAVSATGAERAVGTLVEAAQAAAGRMAR
ncbi:hypothetical protein H8N03_04005 [Ramlibacter sp. USB13]|uniref:Uncharacterized protein n=1 Tax=Ramlibacter cellulosilyticus TaxID=2764187 RepID=A0A923S9W2_9BURK|nr:hypothetical protein [Ramlibacter cellulosilyticus]MBC5782095.1 hypothetical protein [Ramlibacter cellulosilyticus]